MSKLSPLTISRIKSQLARQQEQAEKPERRRYIGPVYICPECGDHHRWEGDAIECCQSDNTDQSSTQDKCPVCGAESYDAHTAVECCLWKDTTPAERREIAKLVEAGSEWTDAIAKVTNTEPIQHH